MYKLIFSSKLLLYKLIVVQAIERKKGIIFFSYMVSFSRILSLKIYQVYLNLANEPDSSE